MKNKTTYFSHRYLCSSCGNQIVTVSDCLIPGAENALCACGAKLWDFNRIKTTLANETSLNTDLIAAAIIYASAIGDGTSHGSDSIIEQMPYILRALKHAIKG